MFLRPLEFVSKSSGIPKTWLGDSSRGANKQSEFTLWKKGFLQMYYMSLYVDHLA